MKEVTAKANDKLIPIRLKGGVKGNVTGNPLAKGFNVTVSVPDTIEIKMVNVSALDDYEMWLFMSAVIINFGVGFSVAYAQDQAKAYFLAIAICALILFGACFYFAMYKRQQLRKKSKTISLRTTEIIEDQSNISE